MWSTRLVHSRRMSLCGRWPCGSGNPLSAWGMLTAERNLGVKPGKAGQVCLPHSLEEEEQNRAELVEIWLRDKIKGYKSEF